MPRRPPPPSAGLGPIQESPHEDDASNMSASAFVTCSLDDEDDDRGDDDDEISQFIALDPHSGRLSEAPARKQPPAPSRLKGRPLPVTPDLSGRIRAAGANVEAKLGGRRRAKAARVVAPLAVALLGVAKFTSGTGGRLEAMAPNDEPVEARKLVDGIRDEGAGVGVGGGVGESSAPMRGRDGGAAMMGEGRMAEHAPLMEGAQLPTLDAATPPQEFGAPRNRLAAAESDSVPLPYRGPQHAGGGALEREDDMMRSQMEGPHEWKGMMKAYQADAAAEMSLTGMRGDGDDGDGGGGEGEQAGDDRGRDGGRASPGGSAAVTGDGEAAGGATAAAPAELASLPLSELSNFKDAWEPHELTDVPVFFHIPKSGGSTVKDFMGACHRFVMATEFGVTDGHGADTELSVVYPRGGEEGKDRSPYVNVDTTTVEGIRRAEEMGFADAGLADAVVTPFIYEANDLFTPTANGRLFAVFRHPIERAVSMFYYIQVADWEPTYAPELKDWAIEQYARSDRAENNWLVRQLTHKFEGDLSDDDLKLAMEVVRRKFLVGLTTDIERTLSRFERIFRWRYRVNPTVQEACRSRLLSSGGSNRNTRGAKNRRRVEPGTEAWELLAYQNNYDLQLYEYIEVLFREQEQFVEATPEDFRLRDATCCKCAPPTFPAEGFTCPLTIKN